MRRSTIDENSVVLVIQDDQETRFEESLAPLLEKQNLTFCKFTDALNNKCMKLKSANIIFAPHRLNDPTANEAMKILLQDTKKARSDLQVLLYETSASRLKRYNRIVHLKEHSLLTQAKALEKHVSQVKRTEFIEIPRLRAVEALKDYLHLFGERATDIDSSVKGLELYREEPIIKSRVEDQPEITSLELSKNDTLVVVAPHPDDAEIGASEFSCKLTKNK